ncbi:hypothetical protein ACCQ10_08310 [Xanthomonas sp. NCPPB 1325]
MVGAQRFQQATSKPRYAVFSFFNKGTSQLSGEGTALPANQVFAAA